MTRIDKKILENIEILSKAMVENGLSEVKFSDGNISYELKNLQNKKKKHHLRKKH